MTGISSTLLDPSSRAGLPTGAVAVDLKSLSAASTPRNVRQGGAVLIASTLTPSASAPSLLESAVANVRWMAQFARPLVAPALRAMVATAGTVTALAEQLAALGRPIAMAIYNLAVAVGEIELAAALAIAAGIVLVTATPTSSNDMVPPSPRNPSRPKSGTTPTDAAVPTQLTPTQTQTQTPRSTPAVRPVAPSAVQVRQSQASMGAAESLTRANAATPPMYAAVEKFYEVASGGRAARANGSLATPMQTVRQSRNDLNAAIVQSESKIAASAPQDRAALKGWHDSLVKARSSIDTWIASADAFSAGLDRAGGSRTAQPSLPRPPTSVVDAPGSARTGAQVAQQLATTYQSANDAMRRGTATSASPTNRTAPAAPGTAPNPAAAQAQAARALLAQTDPITARMNKGVEAFYQQASGGKAARQGGALTDALRTVTESKAELNKLILASNKSIAASSPADYPGLDRWRTKLREARDAVDAWLPKANAFAAGLSGPGGKPAAQPALPAIPSVVAGKGGASSPADSAPMAKAFASAQAALAKSAATRTTTTPGGITAPKIVVASTMPANVKYVADVWLNRATGAVSATRQTGADWLKGTIGVRSIINWPEGSNSAGEVPGDGPVNVGQFQQLIVEGDVVVVTPGPPNNKKPDQDPKHNWHVWAGTIMGLLGTAGAGGFLFYSWQGDVRAGIAQREADFHPKTDLTVWTLPAKTGTPSEKLDAIASAWEHYLGQVPALLQRSGLENTPNASVADGVKAGDNKFADQYKEDAQAFVANLRNEGAAELAKTKDPEAQARVLAALADRQFIPRSFDIKSADARELYKTMEGRPYKALSELTPLVQAAVRSKVGSILASPATPPKADGAVSPGAAAPNGVTPPPVSKTPTQTPQRTPQQVIKDIQRKLGGSQPSTPMPSTQTPTPVVKPQPAAPVNPKPTVAVMPPAVTPPRPVTPPTPSAAEIKQREDKVAIRDLGTAVAEARLTQPPATTSLAALRFTRSMFVEPGKEGDTASIQAGLRKGQLIQGAAFAAQERATGYETKTAIINGPLASIRAVLADLNRLQTAVNQRVAAPVVPAAPIVPKPLDARPPSADEPTTPQTPTLTPPGDTAP